MSGNGNGEDVGTLTADCGYYYCSTNPCGLGGLKTVEYCYEPEVFGGDLIGTHCGCGYYS
jgi:hypothetical protein